jgi:hypothetical protein
MRFRLGGVERCCRVQEVSEVGLLTRRERDKPLRWRRQLWAAAAGQTQLLLLQSRSPSRHGVRGEREEAKVASLHSTRLDCKTRTSRSSAVSRREAPG